MTSYTYNMLDKQQVRSHVLDLTTAIETSLGILIALQADRVIGKLIELEPVTAEDCTPLMLLTLVSVRGTRHRTGCSFARVYLLNFITTTISAACFVIALQSNKLTNMLLEEQVVGFPNVAPILILLAATVFLSTAKNLFVDI